MIVRPLPSACTFVAVFVIFLTASSSQAQPAPIPDDAMIRLERTACFGECPVYSVTIDAKGGVTYEGVKFVRIQGRQTDTIPLEAVASLLETAERIGFFELRDRYRTVRNPDGTETIVTDLPTAFVTIVRDGRSKRVEDYFGAPKGLRELEEQIDQVARTSRWTRRNQPVQERTNQFIN